MRSVNGFRALVHVKFQIDRRAFFIAKPVAGVTFVADGNGHGSNYDDILTRSQKRERRRLD